MREVKKRAAQMSSIIWRRTAWLLTSSPPITSRRRTSPVYLLPSSLASLSSPREFGFSSTITMGESSSSASCIRMVQHLIEQCLLFRMSKEECVQALAKHADIKSVITSTVWKEFEKENKELFQAYMNEQGEKAMDVEAAQRTQKMLTELAAKDYDKEE
ncbi:plant-specific domain TIGR01589 family protein [Musa troglodytarum]|uniref:Plant-specific domain TIGR01589 family protein n=1 Tax=Musa troglodytarum TaxID=320322 RepID=A0A9E7FI71_9LILI|nr:plant-specific domain TIGR01589 family protein [Musa troglodytarum]